MWPVPPAGPTTSAHRSRRHCPAARRQPGRRQEPAAGEPGVKGLDQLDQAVRVGRRQVLESATAQDGADLGQHGVGIHRSRPAAPVASRRRPSRASVRAGRGASGSGRAPRFAVVRIGGVGRRPVSDPQQLPGVPQLGRDRPGRDERVAVRHHPVVEVATPLRRDRPGAAVGDEPPFPAGGSPGGSGEWVRAGWGDRSGRPPRSRSPSCPGAGRCRSGTTPVERGNEGANVLFIGPPEWERRGR
jgi:hypothetical protein